MYAQRANSVVPRYVPTVNRHFALALFRLAFAGLAVVAITAQLLLGLDREGFSVVNFLSFFTIQSNLIAVLALTVTGVRALRGQGSTDPGQPIMLRALATFCMVTTGLVYVALLRGLEDSLQTPVPWINTVLHYVMPCVLFLDWLIDRPRPPLAFRRAVLVLAYPLAWVAYSLIRGPIADWYAYPFLDVRVEGYPTVLVTCLVLALGMAALLWVLARLTRLGGEAADQTAPGAR